jgi:predicted transcriptional regulator YdeE
MMAQLETTTQYRVVLKQAFWFVGVGGCGPYASAMAWVTPLRETVIKRLNEFPPAVDRSAYLSLLHGRETEYTFYDGFAATEQVMDVPAGMVCFQIPAHRYAVGPVRGSEHDIQATYATLPVWAGEQGYELNKEILWLEVYPEPRNTDPAVPVYFEIYLPIR